MRNSRSPANGSEQRGQASLWPWGIALGLALAMSAWWAWGLFKPPSEDSAHPRMPFATGKPAEADKAQASKLGGTQGPINVPPTGAGSTNTAPEPAPPSSAY